MLITSYATALKYFSDIVNEQNFSRAAKKNFISQSAISQAIKKLEDFCGFSLFLHSKNHFQLTSEGRALYEKMQPILGNFDALAHFLLDLQVEKKTHLCFGCMHSFALGVLPHVLPQMQEEIAHLEIDFQLAHGGLVLEKVRKGEVDFGIALDNDDLSGFATIPLYSGAFEIYFSSSLCHTERFLFSDPSYEALRFKQRFQEEFGKNPEPAMRVASWEVIASLTEAGMGYGYFPDYLLLNHPHLEKVDYPFESQGYSIVAVFRKEAYITSGMRTFLARLQGNLAVLQD